MPAQATGHTESTASTPAQAKSLASPMDGTPAQAIGGADSIRQTPAQAIQPTSPTHVAPAQANPATTPTTRTPAQAMAPPKSREHTPAQAKPAASPTESTPARADLAVIRHLGRLLDDLEALRIMNSNRIGAAERELGDALPHLHYILEPLVEAEHRAELELVRAWRKHPLRSWAASQVGVGEKSIARLIAAVGDPADRPNPGKLLAYCGHGDPLRAGKIPKGATQEELMKRGSPLAKKQTWLIASKCVMFDGKPDKNGEPRPRSPYRDVYDERKQSTVGKLHERSCVRCGPAGHPAVAGSPWSDAHRHADAIRIVGKRLLIDLWVAARALHLAHDPQKACEGAGE